MRLIDADALKERIRKSLGIKSLTYLTKQEKAIVDQIIHAPTVDAVPVIRCRDCKHSIENAKHIDVACERGAYDPDFYCAAGERVDGE